MDAKPAVVYAVTDTHMCKLSSLSEGTVWEMDQGEARMLEAICPSVWPEMRLRVELIPGTRKIRTNTGGVCESRFATVRALREFKPVVKVLVTEAWAYERLRQVRAGDEGTQSRRQTTLRPGHLSATADWLGGSRPTWATSREEAERLLRDGYRKEWGLEIEIHWGEADKA